MRGNLYKGRWKNINVNPSFCCPIPPKCCYGWPQVFSIMLCTISAWSGGRGKTGDWGALQGTGGLAITYQQWSAVTCEHSLSMAVWSDVITHRYCFCRVSSSLRLCCLRMWIWSSQASFAMRKGQVWEQSWEEGNNIQYSGFPHTPCPCTIFTCLRTPPTSRSYWGHWGLGRLNSFAFELCPRSHI